MGNQTSTAKYITKLRQSGATSVVLEDTFLDPNWLSNDTSQLPVESVDITNASFLLVPVPIFDCLSIKKLNLSNNLLVSISGIGAMKNLGYLNLNDNRLDYLPDDFSELKNLVDLQLRSNKLTLRSFPDEFTDLKLQSLDISNNSMRFLNRELALLLVKLQSLAIYDNSWFDPSLNKITKETSLDDVKNILEKLFKLPSRALQELDEPIPTNKSNLKQKEVVESEKQPKIISVGLPKKTAPELVSTSTGTSDILKKPTIQRSLSNELKEKLAKSPDASAREESQKSKALPPSPSSNDKITKCNLEQLYNNPATLEVDLSAIKRSKSPLQAPKRAAGPKGRKSPSKPFLKVDLDKQDDFDDEQDVEKDGKSASKVVLNSEISPEELANLGPAPPLPSKLTKPKRGKEISKTEALPSNNSDSTYSLHSIDPESVIEAVCDESKAISELSNQSRATSRDDLKSRDPQGPPIFGAIPLPGMSKQDSKEKNSNPTSEIKMQSAPDSTSNKNSQVEQATKSKGIIGTSNSKPQIIPKQESKDTKEMPIPPRPSKPVLVPKGTLRGSDDALATTSPKNSRKASVGGMIEKSNSASKNTSENQDIPMVPERNPENNLSQTPPTLGISPTLSHSPTASKPSSPKTSQKSVKEPTEPTPRAADAPTVNPRSATGASRKVEEITRQLWKNPASSERQPPETKEEITEGKVAVKATSLKEAPSLVMKLKPNENNKPPITRQSSGEETENLTGKPSPEKEPKKEIDSNEQPKLIMPMKPSQMKEMQKVWKERAALQDTKTDAKSENIETEVPKPVAVFAPQKLNIQQQPAAVPALPPKPAPKPSLGTSNSRKDLEAKRP